MKEKGPGREGPPPPAGPPPGAKPPGGGAPPPPPRDERGPEAIPGSCDRLHERERARVVYDRLCAPGRPPALEKDTQRSEHDDDDPNDDVIGHGVIRIVTQSEGSDDQPDAG